MHQPTGVLPVRRRQIYKEEAILLGGDHAGVPALAFFPDAKILGTILDPVGCSCTLTSRGPALPVAQVADPVRSVRIA
jgi:hypothetical protein